LALLVGVQVLAGASGAAQTPATAPWLGVPLPSGIGDPHRPVVNVAAVTPPGAQVPADDRRAPQLEGARIRRDLETIVSFSRQSRSSGDRVWGRVTGFPAAAATMEWTANQFRAAGLSDVAVQTYEATAPMWWAKAWSVRLLGDVALGEGSRDVVLESSVPTGGSSIAGGTLSAPLVLVGATTDAALPDVDVKGAVAVQRLRPASGAYSERGRTVERAKALAARGAVAIFNIVEQTGNMHLRDFGACGVPCFNLGTADGAFVQAVLERAGRAGVSGQVRAQLTLDAGMLSGLKGQNAVGVVRGASDEIVIVNAHADGWYDAAGDNGDGLAALVALARHFAAPEFRPARTLVFVASGGHHSTGLNGPANFVRMNPAIAERTVLVANLEHVAQLQIRSGSWTVEAGEQPMTFGISNQSPRLADIARRGIERYGFTINPVLGSPVPGDLGGYAPLGVPRVQAIHSGPMYHTSGDVLETISIPGLERAARFFAYFITEVSAAPRGELDPGRR
jgi:hypothetical protein